MRMYFCVVFTSVPPVIPLPQPLTSNQNYLNILQTASCKNKYRLQPALFMAEAPGNNVLRVSEKSLFVFAFLYAQDYIDYCFIEGDIMS